jgi:hypothetical protein
MRLNPLPTSPAVLGDLLRNADRWLDANHLAHNYSEQLARVMASPPSCSEEAFSWLEMTDRQAWLHEEAQWRAPTNLEFWNYADWPFAWEPAADAEVTMQNWSAALVAHSDSLGLAPPLSAFVAAARGLIRDIHQRLEAIGNPDPMPTPGPEADGQGDPPNAAVAEWIREQGRRPGGKPEVLPSRLVEFMKGKREASFEQVKEHVHRDAQIGDRTVTNNVNKTNKRLREGGARYCFRYADRRIYRVNDPDGE